MTTKSMAVGLAAVVAVSSALAGCGGRQQPTATGQCHPWREWVPPQRDEHGEWHDGYCRGERPAPSQS
jgi:hypothetical protein